MKWCSRILLESPVEYGLCLSERDFKRASAAYYLETEDGWKAKDALACAHELKDADNNTAKIVVCMDRKPSWSDAAIYSLLVHESVHVWQFIKKAIGEKRPGIEQEAYSVERIAHNLFESYKQQTRRRKV
jgi:hypothetical protein